MRRLFITLPLTLAVAGTLAGCNRPSETPDTTSTAPSGAPQANATKEPEATYKVVDEAPPGAPAPLAAALKKAKVPPPPASLAVPDTATAVVTTSQGPITIQLNGVAAPLHVKSFIYLAQRGFFNGLQFHRYEPGFVIQGGDPLTKDPTLKDSFGQGGPGYQIPREYNELKHDAMVLAAARSQDVNSAGSQFYFTLASAPHLDQGDGYTVFGKVTSGQANVLKLRKGDTIKSVVILKSAPK